MSVYISCEDLKYKVIPEESLSIEKVRADIKKAINRKKQSNPNQDRGKQEIIDKEVALYEEQMASEQILRNTIIDRYSTYRETMLKKLESEITLYTWSPDTITKKHLKTLANNSRVTEQYILDTYKIKLEDVTKAVALVGKYPMEYDNIPFFKGLIEVTDLNKFPTVLYNKIERELNVLSISSIYEFVAEAKIPVDDPEILRKRREISESLKWENVNNLRELTKPLLNRYQNNTDAKKLISNLEKDIFKNENTKKEYDDYIFQRIAEQKRLLKRIDGIAIEEKNKRYIFTSQLTYIMDQLTQVVREVGMFTGKEEIYAKSLVLKKVKEENIQWVLPWVYCNRVKEAIAENDLEKAKQYYEVAEATHAEKAALNAALKVIQEYENTILKWKEKLETCCRQYSYMEAKSLLKKNPGICVDEIEKEIDTALKKASALREEIIISGQDEDRIFKQMERILEVCSDYDVEDILNIFPPKKVEDIQVEVDSDGSILLKWKYSHRMDRIEFVLLKGTNGVLNQSVEMSAEEIEVGQRVSFVDQNIKEGIPYFYGIYVKRAGRRSEIVACQTAAVWVQDVKNINVVKCDGVVEIKWNTSRIGTVNVLRGDAGGLEKVEHGIKVQNVSLDGFCDENVVNERTYEYFIQKQIQISGHNYSSKGVLCTVTPDEEMDPPVVEEIVANAEMENAWDISWNADSRGDIGFYLSKQKSSFKAGTRLSGTQIQNLGKKLDVEKISKNQVRAIITSKENCFLIPVLLRKGKGIIGESYYITVVDPSRCKGVRVFHDSLGIFLEKWPEEFSVIRVCYRFDRYPQSENDENALKVRISKGEYSMDEVIKLPLVEQNYYITVYGKYLDTEKGFSSGSRLYYKNEPKTEIYYRIQYSKSLLGKVKNVSILFDIRDSKFNIQDFPNIMIWKNNGFEPVDINYGKCVKSIIYKELTEKKGCYICSLDGEFDKDDYIKVFFQKPADGERFIFKSEKLKDYRIE